MIICFGMNVNAERVEGGGSIEKDKCRIENVANKHDKEL